MKNDPFKEIRRALEMMNRINAPYEQFQKQLKLSDQMYSPHEQFQKQIQKQLDFSNQMYSPFHQIQAQANQISKALKPLLDSFNLPKIALDTGISEVLKNQQYWIESVNKISGFSYPKITEWHDTLSKLAHSSLVTTSMTVPNEIFDSLTELKPHLDFEPPVSEGASDLPSTITVRTSEQEDKKKPTWQELVVLLLAIWQTIAPYHISYLESDQQEVQMIEMKKQTSIQEQQLLIESQRLEVEKQQLELMKEQLVHQKGLEEKYDKLIQQIEPHISENQEVRQAEE